VKDLELLDFEKRVVGWVGIHAPHMVKTKPREAVFLALSKMRFDFDLSKTDKLKKIIGDDYLEQLGFWSKLNIDLRTEYIFKSSCLCQLHAYSINDSIGFAQWRSKIDDADLELRLMFGEPLKTVFETWRNRLADNVKKQYNEQLNLLGESIQKELDALIIKSLE
jgi:hypothetical protein